MQRVWDKIYDYRQTLVSIQTHRLKYQSTKEDSEMTDGNQMGSEIRNGKKRKIEKETQSVDYYTSEKNEVPKTERSGKENRKSKKITKMRGTKSNVDSDGSPPAKRLKNENKEEVETWKW